jgi:hypothetical protein
MIPSIFCVQTFKSKDRFRGFEVYLLKSQREELRKRVKQPEEGIK